jgi:hypothetical protein
MPAWLEPAEISSAASFMRSACRTLRPQPACRILLQLLRDKRGVRTRDSGRLWEEIERDHLARLDDRRLNPADRVRAFRGLSQMHADTGFGPGC